FRSACKERSFPVPLMPLLAHMTFRNSAVPSLEQVCSVVRPFVSFDPLPRVYQCRSAWLRELHAGFYLSFFGSVWKDVEADLHEGTDWFFAAHGREVRIGIAHEGKASARSWKARKARKSEGCWMVQARRQGDGLHLCCLAELDAIVSATATAKA
ncbi:MAG: hypothetical protein K2X38_10120, partial [Gemmataceae bacterium]|nr:hypothetical protein [Gemmataceae bacterium]